MISLYDFENENGFFSNLFFFLSTAIYCDNEKITLYIKDDKWKYSYKLGLNDYFSTKILRISKYTDVHVVYKHMNEPKCLHSLDDYREYIKRWYILNETIHRKAEEFKKNIGLPQRYSSIYVRGGDKLLSEAVLYSCKQYVDVLIAKNPDIHDVFLNSDDHNLVTNFVRYIKKFYPYISCYYITNEDNKGTLVIENLRKCNPQLFSGQKSLNTMLPQEIRAHTEQLLCAIEIMKQSDMVVLDYQSNVSRFMKLYFDCPVYDIFDSKLDFDRKVKNPAYGFDCPSYRDYR